MEVAKKRVNFLSLPAELRDAIYEYTLCNEGSISISRISLTAALGPRKYMATKTPERLSVNRQVRHEAAAIYYGANTFLQCTHAPKYRPDSRTALALCLKSLPHDHAIMIKSIEFRLVNQDGPKSNLVQILDHADTDRKDTACRTLHEVVLSSLGLAETGVAAAKIEVTCDTWKSADVVGLYNTIDNVNKNSLYGR